jgi:hypothetical protein
MSDKLEKFVRENSTNFDVLEPRPELWKGIEEAIVPRKVVPWRYYISRAAMVIVIVGASLVAQRVWMSRSNLMKNKTADVEIEIPELREAEMYYNGMINAKMEEVKPLLSQYPLLEEELNTDLSELDSIYSGLKNDLKDNIANQEVIEAMIQNYRLRISILEDMLTFLESQQENKNINNIDRI